MENEGATVVITHHVIDDKHQEYEDWLNDIGPICRSSVGNIDWQIIRPIPRLTYSYTVIIRFDTIENLTNWMESADRKRLIKKVRPLLFRDDNYFIKSGLDFLFTPVNDKAKIPVRWKQYLVTWSAIYPLSTIIPLILLPALRLLNIPKNRLVDSFFVSGIIVLLMVYLIMPYYTRWIKKWLYN
jgi:antibiotic biosynthesis monooxygenase (ABM) superfamily enzyme